MSNPASPTRLPFEENISILLEELVLADKWHRPSILLAVHKSKFGQDKAEKALEERLLALGQRVTRLTVDQEHSDIPHLLQPAPAGASTVFFVSNIDWGGGVDRKDAYRALNIYRELFVDNRLRVVLWLTVQEAASLAHFAPDFWAFRHRVIEFTGQRIPRKVELPAGAMLWDIDNSVDPFDTLEARIAVREELLGKLPNNSEARSARVDLLQNLGYLYWLMGASKKASEEFNAGLQLAADLGVSLRYPLHNGLAIIAYESRQYERCVALLEQAIQEGPDNASLLMNLGTAHLALRRSNEALSQAKKAIKCAPRNSHIWNGLGYINAALSKYDDAIQAFTTAAELAPRAAIHHLALAVCYALVERTEEVGRHLELARKLAGTGGRMDIQIYEAAILGDSSRSLDLARAASLANRITPIELRRDPILSLLLEPNQISEALT